MLPQKAFNAHSAVKQEHNNWHAACLICTCFPYSLENADIVQRRQIVKAAEVDRLCGSSRSCRGTCRAVASSLADRSSSAACLGLLDLGQHALLHPDVHERLHWLHVFLAQQVVESSHVDEVHKASVEFAVAVQIPEGEPVLPVEMCVAAEHLLVHVLDLSLESLREARWLAQPVVGI